MSCNRAEQGSRQEDGDQNRSQGHFVAVAKPDSPVFKTEPSDFSRFRTEEDIGDHHARDSTSTSLVSSRTHAQPKEEDPTDEGVEAKGRSDREGEG
jgi:hypothetical protein